VLIGFLPAARVGDSLLCVGPGVSDSISQGEATVIIGNKPAARLGDPTSHGGVLVAGCPTVIIGSSAQAQTIVVAALNGVPFCEECEKRKQEQQAQQANAAEAPAERPSSGAQGPTSSPAPAVAPAARVVFSAVASPPKPPALLPGEGKVGTFAELRRAGRRGDNLTPHHIPPDAFMKEKVPGYTRDMGISIMMEQPTPGTGGRHRKTPSYGNPPDLSLTPRQMMARELLDARRIYKQEGLYTPEIKKGLLQVIAQNKKAWPGSFTK
jgi:hypothetical protein